MKYISGLKKALGKLNELDKKWYFHSTYGDSAMREKLILCGVVVVGTALEPIQYPCFLSVLGRIVWYGMQNIRYGP